MRTIRNSFGSLAIIGGFIVLLGFVYAQETATPIPAGTISLTAKDAAAFKSLSDTQWETLLNMLEATPTVEADSLPRKGRTGTFFSLQHPEWPPLPGDISGSPVWNLGGGCFLLNDLAVNYAKPQLKSFAVGGMMAMNAPSQPGFDDSGTNSGDDFGSNFQPQIFTTNQLWLQVQMTNTTASLVIHPPWNVTNGVYDLFYTTDLAPNAWQWVLRCVPGQTNLTVTGLTDPRGFLILGLTNDTDGDGLTDAYEKLVSHTDPNVVNIAILSQPQGQAVIQGSNATFSVTASGALPLSYQWRFNGTNIFGATAGVYTRLVVTTNDEGNYSVVITNTVGKVISSNAVLKVIVPPTIILQPTNQIAIAGSNVTFNVAATGTLLNYQWRVNGTNLMGATNATLTLNAVQTTNNGGYSVTVTNMASSVTSFVATLTVFVPPSIILQPTNQITVAGSNVTFSVVASGTLLNYQWYSNNLVLAGAHNSNLVFTNVSTNYSGNYFVVVTNVVGVVTSSVATLTVIDPLLDSDGDGLTDAYEIFTSHTDPTQWDSNSNGISDGDELKPGGLPWRLEQARSSGAAVIYANATNAPEGGACGQCTVYLPAPASPGGATVQYQLGGTAVLNTDFTMSPSSSTLTIPSGSSSGTISVCAINDTVYSGLDRYVIVTLTNSTSCPVDGYPAQVNIIDNDPPGIRVYALPPWIRRPSPTFGTNSAGFYFVRDRGSSNALTVGLSTSGSTAVAGTDYSALPASIPFPANVRTNWLPLTITPSTNTSDKTLVLTMTSAPGCQIDPTNGAATITISSIGLPILPVVQVVTTVADATVSTPGQFAFSRSGPTTDTLRVYYHTVGDTVIGTTNGQDITSYSALPGYVDIPAGAASVTVSVVPNTPSAIAQTVMVVLAAGEYSIGTSNMATVYIDGAGAFYITVTVVKDGIYGASVSQPAEVQIIRYGSAIAPRSMTWSITNQYVGNHIQSAAIYGDGSGNQILWAAHQSVANVKIATTWTSWPDTWQLPTLFLGTNWYLTVPYDPPSAMFSISSSGLPAAIVPEGSTLSAITVRRQYPNANGITLYLTVAGSAVNGTDFSMGTTIGFTAYQSAINVPFQAFANPLTNGWKTAVVTMNSGGFSSQVGQSGSDLAYVRIQDAQVSNPVYDTDIDGDGIPDGYELSHLANGYDPVKSNNPYVDDDRDGLGLIEELQLGTDPSVPDAPPVHPSVDDSDYVPLRLHLGAVGKLINTSSSCGACHAVTLRAGTHISTSPRSNWTNNPALADYTIRFLRGTNYPVQVTDDPYTYVLSTGLTNTVSPHYTAAYIAQFFSGTNGGLYPFITDSNQLLGASQPMVLEALSKSATLYVPDMMIAADVDRDGVVNFTNRADRTATNSPFVFWINDDADSGDDDAAQDLNPLANPVNSANSTIDGLRDLEDFARLQFKITALPKQFLTNGNYQVRVYLTNLVGSPSIRLFPAVESNGGLGYLTNSTMANAQVIASALGVLASGAPVTIPSANWVTITSNSFLLPMIFEGVTTGRCVITFGFSSNSGPAVALSRPFYLDLKRVTDLYEHWTVGDDITIDWSQIPNRATRTPDSAVFGAPQKQEDSDCILFVHGWRMLPWERRAFASTAYKRLYWQNYKGRFVFFSWPTDWMDLGSSHYTDVSFWSTTVPQGLVNIDNFDRSEQRAWNAGPALYRLAGDLDIIYPGHVRVMAHSMGNIVVGEALRLATDSGLNGLFHTYVALEGATPAHCYDSNAPVRLLNSIGGINYDSGTFNLYRYFWEQPTLPASYSTWRPYLYDVNAAGRMVNYFNSVDAALNGWRYNQDLKPDLNWFYAPIGFHRYVPWSLLDHHKDRYEIFSRVDEARCYAMGSQANLGGPFQLNQVNLSTFGFTDSDMDHSAAFNSTIKNRTAFWHQILVSMLIFP